MAVSSLCMFISLASFLLILAQIICVSASYVKELDQRFSELRKEGSWLVEFYAPWCGYCRKLEPIWEEVAKTMYGTSVHVAKLDATIYSGISKEYNVRGFPTIKFIKGELTLTYQGDRTVEDIVQFTEKAAGPAVRELSTGDQLRKVQRDRTVFFLLVTGTQENSLSNHLKDIFHKAAEKKLTEGHFYSILEENLPKAMTLSAPVISVFKDGSNFPFKITSEVTVDNVTDWIDHEKYSAFIQITRSNVHDISVTGKSIVFMVFAEDGEKKKQNERIGKVVKETALIHRGEFHSSLQFGWTLGDEITTNIMMSSLVAPYIMVYNSSTMSYHLMYYDAIKDDFTTEKMVAFLGDVLSGKERGYGGDSYFQRLIRMLYSFWSSVYEIWTSQPIVATLMFGLPLLLFSFIIYMLCTAEGGDEQEFNEDEFDDEDDEEREDIRDLPQIPQELEGAKGKPKTE